MTVEKGLPYPLGVQCQKDGINFAYICEDKDCGVVLYDRVSREEIERIPFPAQYALGDIRCMRLGGVSADQTAYCFYVGDRLVTDLYGHAFLGRKEHGKPGEGDKPLLALPVTDEYDWEADENPDIPYEESIGYCVHVRGFTKHASSGVRARGTFAGVAEKIPYLKELGITTLEFQPVYEFDELEETGSLNSPYIDREKVEYRTNYWGYARGRYFSPKSSYAASDDAMTEFKDMVKALHKNGIEVILQFYFTPDVLQQDIMQILRFWVMTYHVDGFHLKGSNISPEVLAGDPAMSRTKLWYYYFPEECAAARSAKRGGSRRLAEYQDDFRDSMRHFLKGDEGMLPAVMYHLRRNPENCAKINYLTNYDGFTMMDLVSYDRKHNEDNGEDNRDGTDANISWNCGVEGKSRKKAIRGLRIKQIRNAFMLLFSSQGMPLIFMGDEFGNSQNGNNNPYCQDNETTWLNWRNIGSNPEIYEFVRDLIAFRKRHPILHREQEMRMTDYGACGYPDASYHGENPWQPNTAGYSRQLGIMYCGLYASGAERTPDDFIYIVYNMHWEPHPFAMPKLPKGLKWKLCMSTDESVAETKKQESRPDAQKRPADREEQPEQPAISVPGRCVCLFVSEKEKDSQARGTGRQNKIQ